MIDDGGCIPSRQLIQAFSYVSAVSPPSASRYIPTLLITCLIYKPYYCVIVGHAQKVLRRGKIERKKRPDISIVLGFTFRDAYLCVAR